MIIKWLRALVLELLTVVRASPLRRVVLRLLVWLHNSSYHLIAFFSSSSGRHPKHDIVQYHQFFLANIRPNDRVLDVGCGYGQVAYEVAGKAAAVVAIDISPTSIARATKNFQRRNLKYLTGDATTYTFTEKFDAIILSNVLEHIKHRVVFLRKLKELAPLILIRVPMVTRDWITVYKKNEGFEYRLDDTHYIEYDEATFAQEMAAAGLTVKHQHVAFGELYAVTVRQG